MGVHKDPSELEYAEIRGLRRLYRQRRQDRSAIFAPARVFARLHSKVPIFAAWRFSRIPQKVIPR
jgi:hypothetical protein